MTQNVYTACPHDCPDGCAVLVTIEDGRATKVQGDPEHPVTRGFLCGKVSKYLDRVYSPDRVLYPHAPGGAEGHSWRRRVPRGSPGTKRWMRLPRVSKPSATSSGRKRFCLIPMAAILACLNGGSMDRRFFHRLGASQLHRSICSEAGGAGHHFGVRTQSRHRAGAVRQIEIHHRLGARTSTAPTFICGRSSKRRGATAPS